MSNKLGHSQTLTPPLLSAAGFRLQTAYGLALMKPTLLVHEDPGQEQESHSPPSRRAAAPRLIPPGCRSGAGSHSIPRASMSSKRSAGHQSLPHPAQTAGRPDTGDACAQEPSCHPPGSTEAKGNNTLQQPKLGGQAAPVCLRAPRCLGALPGSTACA